MLLHQLLLLPSLYFLPTQSFKLVIKLGKAAACLLVLLLEGSQIVSTSHEICVDCVSFSLDLSGKFLFLVQLGEKRLLFTFKAVKLFSKFFV